MKLFHISPVDVGSSGASPGSRAHVEGIARGLHREGWELILFTVTKDFADPQPSYPFRHVTTLRRSLAWVEQFRAQFRLALQLLRWKGPRPDVIYVRPFVSVITPYLYAMWHRIPYVVELNGANELVSRNQWLTPAMVAIENFWLRHAIGIFATTPEMRGYFARRSGLPESRFEVVPMGCEQDLLDRGSANLERPENDVPTIAYIGDFHERQGVGTLINAVDLIRREIPDVRLLIAGGGEEGATCRDQAKRLGLGDNVQFVGHVTSDEIPGFLSRCTVAAAPYYGKYRTFPMGSPSKLFTYLSCGKMVVTSKLAAMNWLRACPAVRFAEPDDPQSLAQAIVNVLRLPREERVAHASHGPTFVRDGYTWDSLARRTGEVIRKWICGEESHA